MYWPTRLQDATIETIRNDMKKVYREPSPCDIMIANIQSSAPDTRIQGLLEICRSLESVRET